MPSWPFFHEYQHFLFQITSRALVHGNVVNEVKKNPYVLKLRCSGTLYWALPWQAVLSSTMVLINTGWTAVKSQFFLSIQLRSAPGVSTCLCTDFRLLFWEAAGPLQALAQKCYHSVRAVKATLSTNQPVIITQPHVLIEESLITTTKIR